MTTEDDNFDIDIYGDGGEYNTNEQGGIKNEENDQSGIKHEESDFTLDGLDQSGEDEKKPELGANGQHVTPQQPQQTPTPQKGVKRKEHDDRPSDPDAMTALLVSDLFWWTTDDDIRGWVSEAQCEDELKDVTFSEHKVNGKSKGQAFLEFTTLQAATATKRHLESVNETGETTRRHMVTYTPPMPNPFRTLPKDAPMRKDHHQARSGPGFHSPNHGNFNNANMGTGFRGRGGGGFHNRGGGGMNNMGGYGGNRGFQPMGGFQGPMAGGFQNPMGMQNFGFNNRGNMMGGMRGGGMRGRGGMPTPAPNMMNMPMGPMGGMGMNPMGGAMNPMMGGMGMQGGYQGPNPGFNQGFFPGPGNDGSWNPHGAKRSRQE